MNLSCITRWIWVEIAYPTGRVPRHCGKRVHSRSAARGPRNLSVSSQSVGDIPATNPTGKSWPAVLSGVIKGGRRRLHTMVNLTCTATNRTGAELPLPFISYPSSGRDWLAGIVSSRAPTLWRPDQQRLSGAVCTQLFIEPSEERIGVPVHASANSSGGDNGAVGDPVIDGSLRDGKQCRCALFGDGLVGDGHGYQAGA